MSLNYGQYLVILVSNQQDPAKCIMLVPQVVRPDKNGTCTTSTTSI